MLNEISGVGHTVAFPTYPEEMMECINFIESNYSAASLTLLGGKITLSVYPNPSAQGLLHLIFDPSLALEPILIYNSQGQKVLEVDPVNPVINSEELEQGAYFVRMGEQSVKFIVK